MVAITDLKSTVETAQMTDVAVAMGILKYYYAKSTGAYGSSELFAKAGKFLFPDISESSVKHYLYRSSRFAILIPTAEQKNVLVDLLRNFEDVDEISEEFNRIDREQNERAQQIESLMTQRYLVRSGHAIILSWQKYARRAARESTADRENLKASLSKLGFSIEILNNMTSSQVRKFLKTGK